MNALASLLAERIRRFGPMTFAEFMRESLYHPTLGYYSKPESVHLADYFTSVDVHPIFGRLLAQQFAQMWTFLGQPREFFLVEAAAGTGRLASHILEFARAKLPDLYAALRYVAVERSPGRCDQLAHRLAPFIADGRCQVSIELPAKIPAGCVFSNELIDALPVHRIVQQDGKLQELFVTNSGSGFEDIVLQLSTCAIRDYFAAQSVALAEGQQAEAGLEACDWIVEVGRRIDRGFVLTIDYGHEALQLFDLHHMRGTLLAYSSHRAQEDYYASPGEQDLTAHANFTALREWGARSGLETAGLVSQTSFLLAMGQGNDFADLYNDGMSEAEKVKARLMLKTLIYPEGMGETFHVMIQQKGISTAQLTGLRTAW